MTPELLHLTVDEIKWELPDVATFYLLEATGKKITYKAGQFITLVLEHHGEEIHRSYSLSSSPDEERLSITVKRISNGEISRFLLTKVKAGESIYAVKPAGVFTLGDIESERDIVFFAAGSGVTPVFAQLKYILARAGKSKLHLVYSSISENTVIFKNELNAFEAKYPDRLNITYLLSDKASRLNNLVVERLVNGQIGFEPSKADFYLCGPFAYMRMIKLTLSFMHISPQRIHQENFVLETVPVTGTATNYPPKNVRINFNNEVYDIAIGENQSILQAALQNKINLPYSCRSGICSACAAMCKTGKVEMVKNEVLTPADIAKGWILTCTGHPITDDVLVEYAGK